MLRSSPSHSVLATTTTVTGGFGYVDIADGRYRNRNTTIKRGGGWEKQKVCYSLLFHVVHYLLHLRLFLLLLNSHEGEGGGYAGNGDKMDTVTKMRAKEPVLHEGGVLTDSKPQERKKIGISDSSFFLLLLSSSF